jgi:hypothetical protein
MIEPSLKIKHQSYDTLPDHEDVPNPIPLQVGTLYIFQKPGVTLNRHSHVESKAHFTIILSGSFKVSRPSHIITVHDMDFLDFAGGEEHEVTSLTPGALFNGFKHGITFDSLEKRTQAIRAELSELAELMKIFPTLPPGVPKKRWFGR